MEQDGMTRCINRLMVALEGVIPSARVWVRCMELAYQQGCIDTLRAGQRQDRNRSTDAEVVA